MRRDTHTAKVTDPQPARPKSTARPNNRRPTDPAIVAIEAQFEALVALTDSVDFEGACAVVEAEVIGVLERTLATHTVGCSTIRRVATLLARVQRATVAHVEHLAYDVIPACQCDIAAHEAALAERAA